MENLAICCSFIPADRLCFQFLTRGVGFSLPPPLLPKQTAVTCIEVNGKQIQLLYLSINTLKYAEEKSFPAFFLFLKEQYLPGFCDVWELELLPEHKFTAHKLRAHTAQRLTQHIPLRRLLQHIELPFCNGTAVSVSGLL